MTQLNLSGRQSNHPQQNPACPSRRRIDQEPDRGRAGSARHVCRRDRDRQLLSQHPAVRCSNRFNPRRRSRPPRQHPPPRFPRRWERKRRRRTGRQHSPMSTGSTDSSSDFPRSYRLKSQPRAACNETQLGSSPTEPAPMNFVHPGGVMLAAVELPGNSYPGTDFKSGVSTSA